MPWLYHIHHSHFIGPIKLIENCQKIGKMTPLIVKKAVLCSPRIDAQTDTQTRK